MEQVFDGFRVKGCHVICRRHSAMLAFQIHLVGRGDDTAKVMKKNLERSSMFKDLLMVKLAWSKNVIEERDCPKQMVMGYPRTTLTIELDGNQRGCKTTMLGWSSHGPISPQPPSYAKAASSSIGKSKD